MNKEMIEKIALEVCDGIPLEMKMHLPGYSVRFAERFLTRIDAERGKSAVYVVFDGPPCNESGRFVEVETANGRSISAGEWTHHGEYWHLGPLFLSPTPVPEGMALVKQALTLNQLDILADAFYRSEDGESVIFDDVWRNLLAAAQGEKG